MKTLVIGATGTIGKEISKLFHERGHTVIAASRSSEPALNLDDPNSVDDYFSQTTDLDCIVCVAGNASFGKLADQEETDIRLGVNSKLLGQVNLVKKGVAKLKPGGSIILTGGMLAYSPWPETSNIAMVNAGLEGFVKAVALELGNDQKIVIVHPPLVQETAERMGMDGAPWPPAKKVAQTYLSSLESATNGSPVFVNGYSPN